MNFDALKEKLRDQFVELWGKIEENSLFQSLREKYEALSSRSQRLIVIALVAAIALFLLSLPYSYISSSQDSLSTFEDNRELIRGLLKASKSLREPSPLPPEIDANGLSMEVTRALDEFHLVTEQLGGVQPLGSRITNLVPEGVKQAAVSLQLKKLNLRQIVEISHRLQTINAGVKLMGMDIRENATSHYFDVLYKIADFSVPRPTIPEDSGGKGKSKGKPAKSQDAKPDEEKDSSETDS